MYQKICEKKCVGYNDESMFPLFIGRKGKYSGSKAKPIKQCPSKDAISAVLGSQACKETCFKDAHCDGGVCCPSACGHICVNKQQQCESSIHHQ